MIMCRECRAINIDTGGPLCCCGCGRVIRGAPAVPAPAVPLLVWLWLLICLHLWLGGR
jgi:hypothetical protein